MTGPTPWWEGHPALLPPDPDLEPLHQRDYVVRAWKRSDDSMLIRGAVMDIKPGQPFAERIIAAGGDDDGRPLLVHHMVVDLVVRYPDLTITDAAVVFEAFPNAGCPGITTHYRELIGLSIARGFTHQVRERFGGPRGCTHTTALLQAMGPVAVQAVFGMRGSLPRATVRWTAPPDLISRRSCETPATYGPRTASAGRRSPWAPATRSRCRCSSGSATAAWTRPG